MGKNVVTIIGCGWLGTALGKHLSTKGYSVHGSVTSSDGFSRLRESGIQPFLLKLGNREGQQPHEIPASKIAVILLNPRISKSNFDELTRLLKNAGVRQVFLASSTAVYPAINGPVSEKDSVHQESPHSGIDMLGIEKSFQDHFSTTAMRFAGLYGPDRHPGNFFRSSKGGGNNPVNLVHQEDCVRAIHILLVSSPVGAFNICADEHPSRIDLYTQASQSIGLPAPEFGDLEIPFKVVDNTLFKESFGFAYRHANPLDDFTT